MRVLHPQPRGPTVVSSVHCDLVHTQNYRNGLYAQNAILFICYGKVGKITLRAKSGGCSGAGWLASSMAVVDEVAGDTDAERLARLWEV